MNYAATAKKAAVMLKKAGTSMTLRATTPGTFDPVAGTETGETVTDYACVGILTNPFVSQQEAFFANSRILTNDKVALIGATVAVRPKPGNILVVNSVEWQVVAVIAIEPAGIPVLYKLQVRRG